MKKVLIATTICTAMLASCGQNSAEYKKLKAEKRIAADEITDASDMN